MEEKIMYWDPSRPFCMHLTTGKINDQLAKAIPLITPIEKTGRGNYGEYTELDPILIAIKEPLQEHELNVQNFVVDTWVVLYIAHKEEWIMSGAKIPEDAKSHNKLQALGSAITYLKRYSLGAALRIATDKDNDGETQELDDIITKEQYDTLLTLINGKSNRQFVANDILERLQIDSIRIVRQSVYEELLASLQ